MTQGSTLGQPATPRLFPFPLPAIEACSCEIISEILGIGIGHGLRYIMHEAAVIRAASGPKVLQLLHYVVPMLPLDTGQFAPGRIGASYMARNALRAFGHFLATNSLYRVGFGWARIRLQRREESGKVAHVPVAQLGHDGIHGRVASPALLEVEQLTQDIGRRLPGKYRVIDLEGTPIDPVAGGTETMLTFARRNALGMHRRDAACDGNPDDLPDHSMWSNVHVQPAQEEKATATAINMAKCMRIVFAFAL